MKTWFVISGAFNLHTNYKHCCSDIPHWHILLSVPSNWPSSLDKLHWPSLVHFYSSHFPPLSFSSFCSLAWFSSHLQSVLKAYKTVLLLCSHFNSNSSAVNISPEIWSFKRQNGLKDNLLINLILLSCKSPLWWTSVCRSGSCFSPRSFFLFHLTIKCGAAKASLCYSILLNIECSPPFLFWEFT